MSIDKLSLLSLENFNNDSCRLSRKTSENTIKKNIKVFVSIDAIKNIKNSENSNIKFVNLKDPNEIIHLPVSNFKVTRSPVHKTHSLIDCL